MGDYLVFMTYVGRFSAKSTPPRWNVSCLLVYRVGQSREIYSNSVPLSPPHWPCPKRIRPPSWPRVAVASSIQNTKFHFASSNRCNIAFLQELGEWSLFKTPPKVNFRKKSSTFSKSRSRVIAITMVIPRDVLLQNGWISTSRVPGRGRICCDSGSWSRWGGWKPYPWA